MAEQAARSAWHHYWTPRILSNMGQYPIIIMYYGWANGHPLIATISGIVALSWCGVACAAAMAERNFEEAWFVVGFAAWLYGNFWWMYGELTPRNGIVCCDYTANSRLALLVLFGALGVHGAFFFFLNKSNFFNPHAEVSLKYEDLGLKPRFPSFLKNFRQYDQLQTMFWMAKDICWILWLQPLWVIFSFFCIVGQCDLMYLSLRASQYCDCAHFFAQFVWLAGTIVWGAGQVFASSRVPFAPYDEPMTLASGLAHDSHANYNSSSDPSGIWVGIDDTFFYAHKSPRWFSQWLFIFSFAPVVLYCGVVVPFFLYTFQDVQFSPWNVIARGRAWRRALEEKTHPGGAELEEMPLGAAPSSVSLTPYPSGHHSGSASAEEGKEAPAYSPVSTAYPWGLDPEKSMQAMRESNRQAERAAAPGSADVLGQVGVGVGAVGSAAYSALGALSFGLAGSLGGAGAGAGAGADAGADAAVVGVRVPSMGAGQGQQPPQSQMNRY